MILTFISAISIITNDFKQDFSDKCCPYNNTTCDTLTYPGISYTCSEAKHVYKPYCNGPNTNMTTPSCPMCYGILSDTCPSPPPLRVATFNVALIPGNVVAYSQERKPYIVDAINSLDADVVCLQEVFDEQEDIESGTIDSFPYQYAAPRNTEQVRAICDWMPYLDCIQTCLENDLTIGISVCAYGLQCVGLGVATGGACVSCALDVLGTISEGSRDEDYSLRQDVLDSCTESTATAKFWYNGSRSERLLSKRPFTSVDYMDYSYSTRMVTGSLFAEIDRVHIACTHLASLSSISTNGELSFAPILNKTISREKENMDNMVELQTEFERRANGYPMILMGDLNAGPVLTGQNNKYCVEDSLPDSLDTSPTGVNFTYCGNFPNNYDWLISNGYTNSYLSNHPLNQSYTSCTFCHDNQLVEAWDILLDHVLVKNAHALNANRLLDNVEFIEAENISLPLSDHYAIQADIMWDMRTLCNVCQGDN